LVDILFFWIYIVYQYFGGKAMQGDIELQIGKWGNSLGIRLSKHIAETLHLRPKDKLSCNIENGRLILKPLRSVKKYALKELLAEVEEPGKEISWGKAEGDEIW
jgi:antitoxin MazE